MTLALCLSCGALKHGALCPCQTCHREPTGNSELDIAFSDHFVSPSTLRELGKIIQVLNKNIGDEKLKTDVFLKFVSEKTPNILVYKLPEDRFEIVNAEYNKISEMKATWSAGGRGVQSSDLGSSRSCLGILLGIGCLLLPFLVLYLLAKYSFI